MAETTQKTEAYSTTGTSLVEVPAITPENYEGWTVADVVTDLQAQIHQAPVCTDDELELDLDYCTVREHFDWFGLIGVFGSLCHQVGIDPEYVYEVESLLQDLDRVSKACEEGKMYDPKNS